MPFEAIAFETVIDEYIQVRRSQAETLRREIEAARPDLADLRARLLARQAQMEQRHASPSY